MPRKRETKPLQIPDIEAKIPAPAFQATDPRFRSPRSTKLAPASYGSLSGIENSLAVSYGKTWAAIGMAGQKAGGAMYKQAQKEEVEDERNRILEESFNAGAAAQADIMANAAAEFQGSDADFRLKFTTSTEADRDIFEALQIPDFSEWLAELVGAK